MDGLRFFVLLNALRRESGGEGVDNVAVNGAQVGER